jgi:hypothetical protein
VFFGKTKTEKYRQHRLKNNIKKKRETDVVVEMITGLSWHITDPHAELLVLHVRLRGIETSCSVTTQSIQRFSTFSV